MQNSLLNLEIFHLVGQNANKHDMGMFTGLSIIISLRHNSTSGWMNYMDELTGTFQTICDQFSFESMIDLWGMVGSFYFIAKRIYILYLV